LLKQGNTNTGSFKTVNNTLDDGHGNMTINGNNQNTLTINSTNMDGTFVEFQYNSVIRAFFGWGIIGSSVATGIQIYDYVNSQPWLYQAGTGAGFIRTLSNILDDGHGDMSIAGAFTGAGAMASKNNVQDNGSGGQQLKIVTLSTHGTTISTPVASVYYLTNTGMVLPAISSIGLGVQITFYTDVTSQVLTCNAADAFLPGISSTLSFNVFTTATIISVNGSGSGLTNAWAVISRNQT
jgi:hypothetical protein